MAQNKKQNFEDYKKLLEKRGAIYSKMDTGDDIGKWVAALIKDVLTSPLVEDAPPIPDETKKLETKLAVNDKNPYVRARAEVLSKLKKSAVAKIEEMEKTGKTEDRFYKDFIQQVIQLGDKYSA